MFGKRFKLFTLLGFAVSVDASWFLLAILVVWSLAAGVFPSYYPGLPVTTYWVMGVAGAVGLFVSIIVHEFFHSVVARRYGLPMRGITLFIFGGVAEMSAEPPNAKTEFLMAIAGPVASFLIAGLCWAIEIASAGSAPLPVTGVFGYLAAINLLLAIFNLIPAFPLDGGRVLRSALWHWKGNLRQATRISSNVGSAFGLLLIVVGVVTVLFGNLIEGIWWFLIGMFVRSAAAGSYQQLVLRRALEGEPVERFMETNVVSVPPDISIRDLVENYIYRHHYKLFPIAANGHLEGCISTRDVREIPREEWETRTVGSAMHSCSVDNTVSPDTDATKALAKMQRSGASRLIVARGDQLAGVITLKDMLDFLALKVELGDEEH